MTIVGDQRKTDVSKMTRGRPSAALIKDPIIRRAIESLYQDDEFFKRKVQDIYELPAELRKKRTDVSRRPMRRQTVLPEAVLISAEWVDGTLNADLAGKVTPNGAETEYVFKWTSDLMTWNSTVAASAGAGDEAVAINTTLTDLSIGITYYAKIEATNDNGDVVSNILEFSIGDMPEIPDDASLGVQCWATAITQTTATLNGWVDPNSLPGSYSFAWGLSRTAMTASAGGAVESSADPVKVTTDLTGLTPDTRYYFQLTATTAVGTVVSRIYQFRTSPLKAPIVTAGGVTSLTDVSATGNGTVNPNGFATSYYMTWGTSLKVTDPNGAFPVVEVMNGPNPPNQTATQYLTAGEAAMAVAGNMTGLEPNGGYFYQFIATNEQGTSWSTAPLFYTPLAVIGLTGSLTYEPFFVGDTAIEVKQAIVSNTGGAGSTLRWTGSITLDAGISDKISADVLTGNIAEGDSTTVNLTLSQAATAAGEYAGTFDVVDLYNPTSESLPVSVKCYPVYTGNTTLYITSTVGYHLVSGPGPIPADKTVTSSLVYPGNTMFYHTANATYYRWWNADWLAGGVLQIGKKKSDGLWTMVGELDSSIWGDEGASKTIDISQGALGFDGDGKPTYSRENIAYNSMIDGGKAPYSNGTSTYYITLIITVVVPQP